MKNAKEYLGQAYRIDQRINSKIEQVSALNNMATKATSTIIFSYVNTDSSLTS